jgi:peptidoglycan/LPS O-acetylase OafA/YrhL
MINNSPNGVSNTLNTLYLLLSRPLFIIGFSMTVFPVIVGSKAFKPLHAFLSHSFWVPLSRLSYGAFLSHGIFMQFREFNSERGQWGCGFDALLFFFAYWTFSFLFSFGMSITFEIPIAALWYEFALKKEKF